MSIIGVACYVLIVAICGMLIIIIWMATKIIQESDDWMLSKEQEDIIVSTAWYGHSDYYESVYASKVEALMDMFDVYQFCSVFSLDPDCAGGAVVVSANESHEMLALPPASDVGEVVTIESLASKVHVNLVKEPVVEFQH